MQKMAIAALLLHLAITSLSQAQNKKSPGLIKSGWNVGALPTITFDTDLGFQYGALVNLFQYGDGSRYPAYDHSLYFEVSRFTKGSGIYRFYYDSDQLLNGLQTSIDLSYLPDQTYDFYGFNGYEAIYHDAWTNQDSENYKSRVFYKYDRRLFRWKADLQGKITESNRFRWITGFNLQNFKIGSVNIEKLNKGKSGNDILPDIDGLYDLYRQWGIISPEEADGGFVPTFKAGLVLDSRDNKPNPMKGIWAEAVIEVSPKILGAESSFSNLSLTHRQYFTILPNDLSFAYRLNYQTKLGGNMPFYYRSQMIVSELRGASSEGLGGAKTLRGVRRNRVVGDGFAYGNAELRWKFARFRFINNNFYLGLNSFVDVGKVTNTVDVKKIAAPKSSIPQPEYFDWDAEKWHTSYGAGFRAVMNENFVVSFDYGMAANKQDGTSGLYIGLGYLF